MAKRTFSKKCANCRKQAVELATLPHYEVEIDHDGRKYPIRVADFVVPQCAECGHMVIDANAEQRIDDVFHETAGLLRPAEILRKRQELNLSQVRLAELLAVSVSTLSRWETGAQIQQRSLDRFMRLFFESPVVRDLLAGARLYGANADAGRTGGLKDAPAVI